MTRWTTAVAAAALTALQACNQHDEHGEAHAHSDEAPATAAEAPTAEVRLTTEAATYFGVTTQPAARRELRPTFSAPATVSFDLERVAQVGTLVSGRVIEVRAKLGDRVKRGDILLVLNSPQWGDLQLSLVEKRLRSAANKPAVEVAKSAYERAKGLHEAGQLVALAEVERLSGQYRAAEAAAAEAEGDVTSAANRLAMLGADERVVTEPAIGAVDSTYVIRAPVDGTVVERHASMGEAVHPDRDSLFMLADETVHWVMVDVPEAKVSEAAVGSRAFVSVPSLGHVFEGRVAYVAPRLDPATRTASARVVLKDVPGLKAGMFAEVEIETAGVAATPATLAVPESAVQMIEGESVVFVPAEGRPNTFVKRAVQVGDGVGPWVPILAGLNDGEQVVTTGSFVLKADLLKASASHDH